MGKKNPPKIRHSWLAQLIDNPIVVSLCLVILSFLIYANSLGNGFVSDDLGAIVYNFHIRDTWKDALMPGRISLGGVIVSLLYILVGPNALWYHLASVFIHALITVLVFILVLRLMRQPYLAALSGVLFALHPLHTEAVDFISALPYLLYSLFSLTSLLLVDKIESKKTAGIRWIFLVAITSFLAFSSSEKAIMLPFLIGAYLVVFASWKRMLAYWPVALATLVFGLLLFSRIQSRIQVMSPDPQGRLVVENPLRIASLAIGTHLRLFALPSGLSLYHEFNNTSGNVVFSLGAIALGFLALGLVLFKKNRRLFFFYLIFLVGIGPTILPLNLGWIAAERYVYFPSIGLTVLLAAGVVALKRINNSLFWGSVLFLTLSYSFLTIQRNRDWKDEPTLWQASLEASPDSSQAYVNMGSLYHSQGEIDKAVQAFTKAAQLNPGNPQPWSQLAYIFILQNDLTSAKAALTQAIRINPYEQMNLMVQAKIFIAEKNFTDAEKLIKRAQELDPNEPELYKLMADYYVGIGDTNRARQAAEKAYSLNPNDIDVLEFLGKQRK